MTLTSSVGPETHRSGFRWCTARNGYLLQFDCNFLCRIRDFLCSQHGLAPVISPQFHRSWCSRVAGLGRRWSVLLSMTFSYSLTTYDRSQGKLRQRGGRGNSSLVGHSSVDSWSRLSDKKMPSRCGLVSFGHFLF